jgi:hypothetical protein
MSMSVSTSSRTNLSAPPSTALGGARADSTAGNGGLRLQLLCNESSRRQATEGLDGAWELTIELATD